MRDRTIYKLHAIEKNFSSDGRLWSSQLFDYTSFMNYKMKNKKDQGDSGLHPKEREGLLTVFFPNLLTVTNN